MVARILLTLVLLCGCGGATEPDACPAPYQCASGKWRICRTFDPYECGKPDICEAFCP
jgi:hypothetical protein